MKMSCVHTTVAAAAVAIASAIMPASALTIVIDNFDVGPFGDTASTSGEIVTNITTGLSTANVIGGGREVRTHKVGGGGDVFATSTQTVGAVTLNLDAGTTGHVHLAYGNFSDGGGGDLAEDFTVLGPAGVFEVVIAAGGIGTGAFEVVLGDSSGTTQKITKAIGNLALPQTITWTFAEFGAVNLADIDNITLNLDGLQSAGSAVISSFHAFGVPEPGTFLLLAMGLGIGVYGRQRQRRKTADGDSDPDDSGGGSS